MRALVYQGPYEVSVEQVPDARVQEPTDALVMITSTNICGSDLHMYEGRTSVPPGTVLGHENMGIVVEVGEAVNRVTIGDRVSVPFNIACGTCENCEHGRTASCLRMNPGMAGAAFGYADMGPYPGGQAEYLRVPFADFNCLDLPPGEDHELDYAMLSDVFPTGYHAAELAQVEPGDAVVVYGAGPVGLLAAYSATLRGAAQVMCVDEVPSRLQLAERIGAVPIKLSEGPAVEQVLERTGGMGAHAGVDAVGYQAHEPDGAEHVEMVLNELVRCVRATGRIGVVGVYQPEDPGANGELAKRGKVPFDMGLLFAKGQRMGAGQCDVKAYNRALRDLITAGRAAPSFLVSHELTLDQADEGYAMFDRRAEGWTKVVLHPPLAA